MERPATLVVDASVAVKWFSQEDGSDKARELLDRHIDGDILLVAPDLILYEVANALRYNPGFGKSQVSQAIQDLLDSQLRMPAMDHEWLDDVVAIAFDEGLTIYDACYLGLARSLKTGLCTADRSMLEKVGDEMIIPLGSILP